MSECVSETLLLHVRDSQKQMLWGSEFQMVGQMTSKWNASASSPFAPIWPIMCRAGR